MSESDSATNPYTVLGLKPDASDEEISKAFRRLAARYHPDRCTDADADERFREARQAYELLINPNTRAAFDAVGDMAAYQHMTRVQVAARNAITQAFGDLLTQAVRAGSDLHSVMAGVGANNPIARIRDSINNARGQARRRLDDADKQTVRLDQFTKRLSGDDVILRAVYARVEADIKAQRDSASFDLAVMDAAMTLLDKFRDSGEQLWPQPGTQSVRFVLGPHVSGSF